MPARKRSLSVLIAIKEFREIFRDKRTILSVVIGPLVVTPGLFAIIGVAATKKQESVKAETYPVGVVAAQASPQILQAIQATPGLKVENTSLADAETQIKRRKLNPSPFKLWISLTSRPAPGEQCDLRRTARPRQALGWGDGPAL